MTPYAEVIGDPVAHSRSPLIHGFWAEATGVALEYRARRVGVDNLAPYFDARRSDPMWRGCNLTAPLKHAALPNLERVSDSAAAIGAVNCVVPEDGRLTGSNSDIDGIAEALSGALLKGHPVTVIGAGGAARAAVYHLAQRQPSAIRIVARNSVQAQVLRDLVPQSIAFETYQFEAANRAFAEAAAIINASPLGMVGASEMPEAVVGAVASAAKDAIVMDMVYRPLQTRLLHAARLRGLEAIDGLAMLIGQAGPAFRLFCGTPARRDRDPELSRRLRASLVDRPIALVGMPGAGKTTTGRVLARQLGLDFVDSDLEIERSTGTTIPELFDRYGESKFRGIERRIVAELIAGGPRVVALGGGALSNSSTFQLVRSRCITVWLKAPVTMLVERLRSAPQRPLLAGRDLEEGLSEIALAREPRFAEAEIRVGEGSPEDTAKAITCALAGNFAKNDYSDRIDAPPVRPMIKAS